MGVKFCCSWIFNYLSKPNPYKLMSTSMGVTFLEYFYDAYKYTHTSCRCVFLPKPKLPPIIVDFLRKKISPNLIFSFDRVSTRIVTSPYYNIWVASVNQWNLQSSSNRILSASSFQVNVSISIISITFAWLILIFWLHILPSLGPHNHAIFQIFIEVPLLIFHPNSHSSEVRAIHILHQVYEG